MTKPGLRQQAEAVQLAALNKRGHINILEGMVAKGRRPQTEIQIAKLSLPALDEAVVTLTFLEAHAEAFRRFLIENNGKMAPKPGAPDGQL